MKNSGFTLIETIIYAGLISFILSMAVLGVVMFVETKDRIAARIEVEEEAAFLMGKITWALQNAVSIITPTVGASTSTLSVNRLNFPQNPITLDADSGTMRISYAGGQPVPLSNGNVRVSALSFEHLAGSSSRDESVKVTLAIEFRPKVTPSLYAASTTIETTIALRTK